MNKLTPLSLAATTFFIVSGGPYALEETIAALGWKLSLIVILIVPFVWALPIAMLVGEMAAAHPASRGYYDWIKRSNGTFMASMLAWSALAMSFFDMAIYPTLFVTYLAKIFPALSADMNLFSPAWFAGSIMIAACAVACMFGIKFVGRASTLIMLALLAPFIIMFLGAAGMPTVTSAVNNDGSKEVAILMCLWNYLGWDNASTLAKEVDQPQRTYPRGIFLAVLITTCCYAAAIFVASKYHTESMVIGSWVDIGEAIGGSYLRVWTAIGGMLCGIWMFSSLVTSYSQIPLSLAEDKILPRMFCVVNSRGVPYMTIIVSCAVYALSMSVGLKRLIEIDVILYGVVYALQAISLITIRVMQPSTGSHFRVPFGVFGLAYVVLAPITMLVIAIWFARAEIGMWSISSYKLGLCVVALCALVAAVSKANKDLS